MMYDYDLFVIGSGPGGQRAAVQAAKLGKRVGITEAGGVVGGVAGLAGLVGGMGAGAVTGLGHGLYRGGGSALGAMYRNPRKTAAAGVAGTGIGINTGMIGAGMGGAA